MCSDKMNMCSNIMFKIKKKRVQTQIKCMKLVECGSRQKQYFKNIEICVKTQKICVQTQTICVQTQTIWNLEV